MWQVAISAILIGLALFPLKRKTGTEGRHNVRLSKRLALPNDREKGTNTLKGILRGADRLEDAMDCAGDCWTRDQNPEATRRSVEEDVVKRL